MREILCLYWEDEDNKDRYASWIRRAWEKVNSHVPLEVKVVDSPEMAEYELSRNDLQYRFFVADIYLGHDDRDPRGLHLIDQARALHPDLAIIALSRADDAMGARARDAGADAFISKQSLHEGPRGLLHLGNLMIDVLKGKGFEPLPVEEIELDYDEDNLLLASVVENLGRQNIKKLAVKILDRMCRKILVKYVSPGLSGASVLQLDCEVSVERGFAPEGRSILLKASRDKMQIENEISRKRSVDTFPLGLFVPFAEGRVVDSGGWYALGGSFQASAVTLFEWLSSSRPTRAEVEQMLSSLFLEGGLSEVYRRSIEDGERPNRLLWEVLTLGRRARIRLAIRELRELIDKYCPPGAFEEDLIMAFLKESRRVVDLDEESVPRGAYVCRCHGDLHSRNILVDYRRNAKLIDPANIHQDHWAVDVARLAVDLLVAGWDKGAKSHEWDGMERWLDIMGILFDGREGVADSANEAVWFAVNWLRSQVFTIHGDVGATGEAEFRLAVAVEFLRSSYRVQDLPAPKRVLSLAAACGALRGSAAEFKRIIKPV